MRGLMIFVFTSCAILLAQQPAVGQFTPPQDDGTTLLLLLQPGADMGRVESLLREVQATVVKSTTIQTTGRQILQVQTAPGNLAAAESYLQAHGAPDISAVERNYMTDLQGTSELEAEDETGCPPNDPFFAQQWALPDLHFPEARCEAHPRHIPAITFIDSGVTPISPSDEMRLIQQFNFTNGASGTPESPFDSGLHGTAVAGVVAAKTNNHKLLAGVASVSEPVFITMLRTSNDGTTIHTVDVFDALAWCIDHQEERRGPGPISVSINTNPPFTFNSSPFAQALAQALRAQGDLVIQGAGNSGLEDPTPEQFVRRVAATDEHDQLASFSVFGPFHAAAPGVDILVFFGSQGLAFASGTSLSTPYWSGSIAFLMSLCPHKLTAPKADAILYDTATVTSQGYHIPNLEAARDRCERD